MHCIETKIIQIKDLYTDPIDIACDILKNGGLVAFPTETVYGLGALATNSDAVKKIFQVKGRPADNPLIVHIDSAKRIEEIAYIDEKYIDIVERITPGPITFVLRKKKEHSIRCNCRVEYRRCKDTCPPSCSEIGKLLRPHRGTKC